MAERRTEDTEDIQYIEAGADDDPRSGVDGVLRTVFVIALGLLVFVAGALVTIGNVFPGPQISRAYEGGRALYDKLTKAQYTDVYQSDLWFDERGKDKGVTARNPAMQQAGVTLFTSGNEAAAFLMDMDGQVLHAWRRPYSTVWRRGEWDVARPQPDSHVYFRHAHLYPNGDLLAIYEGVGDTPYGYGMVKLDKDSNVIWTYGGHTHHQFDVGPDGKIYALTHEFVDDEVEKFAHLARPRLEDFLVVLSPDGEVLKKVRLLTVLAKSRYRHMLYTVSGFALPDPLHANSVKVIDGTEAANFPFGEEGQILLSFRETNGLVVYDLQTDEIVWGTRGPWIGQHDPDIMANGNILLFDNYGNYAGPEGVSRVIEFNPRNMEIVWQYAGTAERPLNSLIRSDQQRLENGNTVITESNGGRIVEVTPEGKIAWEFVNPIRGGEGGRKIPIIAWSERIDPKSLDPALLQQPLHQAYLQTETSQ